MYMCLYTRNDPEHDYAKYIHGNLCTYINIEAVCHSSAVYTTTGYRLLYYLHL